MAAPRSHGGAGLKASRSGDDRLDLGFHFRPEHRDQDHASDAAVRELDIFPISLAAGRLREIWAPSLRAS